MPRWNANIDRILKELDCDEPFEPSSVAYLHRALYVYFTQQKVDNLARPFGLTPTRRGSSAARKAAFLGSPVHSQDGKISNDGIWQLAFEIETATAHPKDVIAALRAVYEAVDAGRQPSRQMRHYLAVAFQRLKDSKTITVEQAFGLKRPVGRAGPSIERKQLIARDLLLRCLRKREQLRTAATALESTCGIRATQILGYFRDHKNEAIMLAKEEIICQSPQRDHQRFRWRKEEKAVLKRILARGNAAIARAGIKIKGAD